MKKQIKKNEELKKLIEELKKASISSKVNIWKRIATDLEKPSRRRRVVNLYKIEKNARSDETIVVPGKVLGTGDLNKKLTIAAYNFSEDAFAKINQKGTAISIMELIQKNPQGKKVRILG
ncbi:MAG: 50S ribosomal protein L18e [Nanoarchaeota archaeon]|nr:50S ribosomal protein L18e [Nanoarchaeota archaeon]MBU1030096.1 50S ribosomal protein L18e [Nanoarchaeota archaeon]MBU1849942.1 50S ribosomal protein L18e [Nanoarchaeota archaeon]